MQLAELFNSCAHDRVAAAAVASLGDGYLRDVVGVATSQDMSVGHYVSSAVRCFAVQADDGERSALRSAMRGAPAPVLAGLDYILQSTRRRERGCC